MGFKNSKGIVNCVSRSLYSSFFCSTEIVTIESPWELKGECTVSNSIFSYFEKKSGLLCYDYPLTVWFEETVNLFKKTKEAFEKHLGLSLDPKHLIEIEEINLSTFFDTGKYFSKSQYRGMMSDDVHQYYARILWGEDMWIGCCGIVLEERLDKLQQYIAEGKKKKIEILSEVMQEDLEEWMSSSKLQALLWLKEYLGKLKPADIDKICKKYKRKLPFDTDLVRSGFDVVNPDKTIPALYTALVDNKLIKGDGKESFIQAFQEGKGTIQWLEKSKRSTSIGAKSLIHLINRMVEQELIEGYGFIKITASIFIDKHEKPFKHSSLTQSNAETPKNKDILNKIVGDLMKL